MILVFDLDDTIYDEILFVKSGYYSVAAFLEKQFDVPKEVAFKLMIERFSKDGRDNIFDYVLRIINHYSKKNVKKCLNTYRSHKPDIQLDPEAVDCFNRFKAIPLYIVTDGNKVVQKNKIDALGVKEYVKKAIPTHLYGLGYAKPSPLVLQKIAKWEATSPSKIVYIGDNPNKDFVGIKPLGFKTIRIMKGMFRHLYLSSAHEAHLRINSLDDLTAELIQQLINTNTIKSN